MIDYIKIGLNEKIKDHLTSIIEFKREYSEKTGEGNNYKIAEYKNLKIKIFDSGRIIMYGSIHKFYDTANHNYNDFTLLQFLQTVKNIENDLSIDFYESIILQFEFGVNIIPPIPVSKILNNLLLHKSRKFQDIHIKNGDYRQCVHNQFILKIYDKGKQYHLENELLRFEVKVTCMEQFRKIGIDNLFSLTNPNILKKLGELLVNRFNEILLYDPTISQTKLTSKEKLKLNDWRNSIYWIELIQNTPRSNKNKIARETNKFNKFTISHSENIIQQISKLIFQKWGQLTNFQEEVISRELGTIDNSYIDSIFPNYDNKTKRIKRAKKECIVTGLDISMQKENSKFLCISGIKYFYMNEPLIYEKLEKRLSAKWKNCSNYKRFSEIAHSVRNEYFNRLYKIQKLIRDDNLLFNNIQLIDSKWIEYYNLQIQ